MTIDPKAKKFVEWSDLNNLLIFRPQEADSLDVGYYDISIKVEDNFATAVIEDYVECEDRVFATDALRDQCKDRENAVVYYNITLHLKEKDDPDNVQVLPEAELVVDLYEGRVYDLGDQTLDDVYSLAIDDFEQYDDDQIETSFDIQKLELIDLANQQDQAGQINLEELRA